MSFVYTNALRAFGSAEIDLDTGGDDIRVLTVMSNTTADTEEDVTTVDGFSTLDEYDGANYVRKALANEAMTADNTNDRGEFDADDITHTSLGVGSRQAVGHLLIKHVTDDTDSIPLAYIDDGGFPFDGNGGDVATAWNVEGILQFTNPA